jgi:hypothetical protein
MQSTVIGTPFPSGHMLNKALCGAQFACLSFFGVFPFSAA